MLKKKELLSIPKLIKETEGTISQAAAEVLTIDGDKILHIDVTECGEVIVRYFADKSNSRWLCFGGYAGWTQMGLSSAVDYELSRGDYYRYDWGGDRYYSTQTQIYIDVSDTETILNYIGTRGWSSALFELSDWEAQCRAGKKMAALNRKQKRIDTLMERVPELPDDFQTWIAEKVFPEEHIYVKKAEEKGKKEYHCLACGKKGVRKMQAPIGRSIQCPRCGKTVRVKSKDRKYNYQQAAVVLIQPIKIPNMSKDKLRRLRGDSPGYIERQLKVICEESEKGREFVFCEDIRAIVPAGQQWGDVYYGEYSGGRVENQMFWDTNSRNKRWLSSYLYPGNLQEILPLAGLEHSGIDILARKGIKINVDYFLINFYKRPWIEYLIKAGLYNLVQDIVDKQLFWRIKLNEKGTSLQECLRLDGAGVNRLKQMNGDWIALGWLQLEKRLGRKISQESLEYLMKAGIAQDDKRTWKMFCAFESANKLANYLKKQSKLMGESAKSVVSFWEDYMDMARRLKMRTDLEMFYKPKDLRAAHDECLALLERQKASDRADEVRKKYPEAELVLQMAQKYAYVGKEYQIIIPQKIEDIVVEGATLGHCIDRTDIYFDRIQQRTSILAFLRKNNRPDAPWYTLEIEPGGTIRQKRTVRNTQNVEDIKAFTPFLREWQQYVKKMLSDEEKELAKASRETRLREYKELRDKKEPVRNGLLAGKLLADVLEADLMEAM